MTEYIRREDATKIILEYVTRQERIGRYAVTIHELKQNTADILGELPSDDVASVVHSRWKYKCGEIQCPECGNRIHRIDLSGYLNFCPNCGAKMDGGDEHG